MLGREELWQGVVCPSITVISRPMHDKRRRLLYWNGQQVLEWTTSLDISSRTLYWNGQLVWTPALGLYL